MCTLSMNQTSMSNHERLIQVWSSEQGDMNLGSRLYTLGCNKIYLPKRHPLRNPNECATVQRSHPYHRFYPWAPVRHDDHHPLYVDWKEANPIHHAELQNLHWQRENEKLTNWPVFSDSKMLLCCLKGLAHSSQSAKIQSAAETWNRQYLLPTHWIMMMNVRAPGAQSHFGKQNPTPAGQRSILSLSCGSEEYASKSHSDQRIPGSSKLLGLP